MLTPSPSFLIFLNTSARGGKCHIIAARSSRGVNIIGARGSFLNNLRAKAFSEQNASARHFCPQKKRENAKETVELMIYSK